MARTIGEWEREAKELSYKDLATYIFALRHLKEWKSFHDAFEGFSTFVLLAILEAEMGRRDSSSAAASGKPRAFYQDGADFYDEETKQLVASYPDMVKGDFDAKGAKEALKRFLREHADKY
jgi:hypothetical protein